MNELSVIVLNDIISGKKIRYIDLNGINYFIYSLNEKDEDNYEKLYINRIVDNNEIYITDFEWENIKNLIPTIVKEIRTNNISLFKDLDQKKLNNINVEFARVFKLKSDIVEIITKRESQFDEIDYEIKKLLGNTDDVVEKKEDIDELDEFLNHPFSDSIVEPTNPYEEETLESIKEENRQLQERVFELEEKINSIKALLN